MSGEILSYKSLYINVMILKDSLRVFMAIGLENQEREYLLSSAGFRAD